MLVGGDAYAQLFLGGPNGVSTTAAQNLASLASDAHRIVGGADFNGDGFPDAIVASDLGQSQISTATATLWCRPARSPRSPRGWLVTSTPTATRTWLTTPSDSGGPSGPVGDFQAVAGTFARATAGDTNHDGYSDILTSVAPIVGVPEPLRVYFGGAVGCTTNDCPRYAPILSVSANVGGAGGIGDVNGDGFDDVALFVPADGAVHLFYGSPAGPPATPSRRSRPRRGSATASATCKRSSAGGGAGEQVVHRHRRQRTPGDAALEELAGAHIDRQVRLDRVIAVVPARPCRRTSARVSACPRL